MHEMPVLMPDACAHCVRGNTGDGSMTTTCGTPGYVAPEVLEQNAGGYGPEVFPI